MSGGGNELQDWYLAFLRNSAINSISSRDLTPMTLIKVDQEMIMARVEAEAQARAAGSSPN